MISFFFIPIIFANLGNNKSEGKEYAFGNVGTQIEVKNCDTISKQGFFEMVKEGLYEMKDSNLCKEKNISLIKIFSTLYLANIYRTGSDSLLGKKFKEIFLGHYLPMLTKKINITYGKGIVYYTKEYDLYIGIPSESRCRDIYFLIDR